jgi:cytochrome P450
MAIAVVRFWSLWPVPLSIPTPMNVRMNRSIAILDKIVNDIIAGRRAGQDRHEDLLDMLMQAKDEDTGGGMSDRQLRDEVMTLFMAGHETTANALSFFFYLLSGAPEVEERLVEEVRGVSDPLDMARLPYLTMCFHEALRLYPPAWLFSRQAVQEDVVSGYRIKAGSTLLICPYTLHRHPSFWPDADRFDPLRFTPEAEAQRPKMAYIPFGAGPRMCIGWTFAMMEAQIAIAIILQRVRLTMRPGQAVTTRALVTLRPAHPIMMEVHPR